MISKIIYKICPEKNICKDCEYCNMYCYFGKLINWFKYLVIILFFCFSYQIVEAKTFNFEDYNTGRLAGQELWESGGYGYESQNVYEGDAHSGNKFIAWGNGSTIRVLEGATIIEFYAYLTQQAFGNVQFINTENGKFTCGVFGKDNGIGQNFLYFGGDTYYPGEESRIYESEASINIEQFDTWHKIKLEQRDGFCYITLDDNQQISRQLNNNYIPDKFWVRAGQGWPIDDITISSNIPDPITPTDNFRTINNTAVSSMSSFLLFFFNIYFGYFLLFIFITLFIWKITKFVKRISKK